MKKALVLIVALLAAITVFAQAKAAFTKDHRIVAQWLVDNANGQKFITWAETNLTQEQIADLELLMFPEVDTGQKTMAIDLIKLQMQQLNLEKTAETKPIYAALEAAEVAMKPSTQTVSTEPFHP